MEERTCPACGLAVQSDASFCNSCGCHLQAGEAAPGANGQAAPAAVPPLADSGMQLGIGEAPAPGPVPGQPQPPAGYGYPPNSGYVAPPPAYMPAPQPMLADDTVSVWSYIWPGMLLLIPFLGWLAWLVVMIVLAVGSGQKPSFRNYARANLIMLAVGVGLWLLAIFVLGGVFWAI